MAHNENSSFIFLTEGVHISHNDSLWCVNNSESYHYYKIAVKDQGQICLKFSKGW